MDRCGRRYVLNAVSANVWWFLVVVETLHLHIIAVQA